MQIDLNAIELPPECIDQFAIAEDIWDNLPKEAQVILKEHGYHPIVILKTQLWD